MSSKKFRSKISRFFIMATLILSFTVPVFSQEEYELGINLGPIHDYSTDWIFVDRMKNARPWIPFAAGTYEWDSGVSIPLNAQGYPLEIPYDPDGSGSIAPQAVKTLIFRDDENYPSGRYTLIFDGTGTVQISLDANGTFTQSGVENHFTVSNPSNDGLLLTILESSSSDPVNNIRVIMPGYEDTYESQIFHPLFLSRLNGLKSLRFMWWQQTIDSLADSWSEITPFDYYTQATEEGVAPEYMILLSNRLRIDPWICIPHSADDNYVRQLARLFLNDLDTSLKIYLEYTNETWNGIYPVENYVEDLGMALGLSSNRFQAGLFYYARRSAEIFAIFEDEFGSSERIVRVISSQAANPWTAEQVLFGLSDSTINPTSSRADVLSIAPYFGGGIADEIVANGEVSSISVDEILDRMQRAVYSETAAWTAQNKEIADEYNVDMIAYEGGPHLVGTGENVNNSTLTSKLLQANRSDRMEQIYLDMLNVWYQNGGELFTIYNYISKYGKYGSWGILEYQNQSDTPRYNAVQQFLSGNTSRNVTPAKPFNIRIRN